MQLLPAAPNHSHQIGILQNQQMLGDRLPAHTQVLTQLTQSLPIVSVQLIKQFSSARIGKRFKYLVHAIDYMQPFICMSNPAKQKTTHELREWFWCMLYVCS